MSEISTCHTESLIAAGALALDIDGDLGAGARWFECAHQVAETAGDPHALAAAALGLGGLRVYQHRTARAAAVLQVRLRRALSLVEAGSPLGIRLRARLAAEADHRTGGHAAILAVLADARTAPDPVTRVEALSLALQCTTGPEHGPLRQDLADELLEASVVTGRRGDLLAGVLWQAVTRLQAGDPHAQRLLGELRDLLSEGPHLATAFHLGAADVLLGIRAGRLTDDLARDCAALGAAAGDADAGDWHRAQLVAIRWFQGRLAEELPALAAGAVDHPSTAALAVAAAQAGDRRTAESALARLTTSGLAALPRTGGWLVTMGAVVEAADLLARADVAAQAYELLTPFEGLPMTAAFGVCYGSVRHALGVAALTCGRPDDAVRHLRAAVDANLALGHWPATALSRRRHAQALRRRGGPQDAALARREEAAAQQETAGMGLAVAVTDEPPGAVAVCARDGLQWRIDLADRSVLVEHSVGMLHLAVLLANPGTDVAAIELAGGAAVLGARNVRSSLSAQPVLDRSAVHDYRQRLARLRTEIDDLEAAGQPASAAKARTERDWLLAELATSAGLGGRRRSFSDDKERARLAVGRAIRRSVARVSAEDPVVGEHLRRRIHTGVQCSYRPGTAAARWAGPSRQAAPAR